MCVCVYVCSACGYMSASEGDTWSSCVTSKSILIYNLWLHEVWNLCHFLFRAANTQYFVHFINLACYLRTALAFSGVVKRGKQFFSKWLFHIAGWHLNNWHPGAVDIVQITDTSICWGRGVATSSVILSLTFKTVSLSLYIYIKVCLNWSECFYSCWC